MAHCPYAQLADLESVLADIRTWPGIKEPKPGVFYLGSTAFLHFHLKDDRRWADVRDGKDWGPPVDAPFHPTRAAARQFLREVEARYQRLRPPR